MQVGLLPAERLISPLVPLLTVEGLIFSVDQILLYQVYSIWIQFNYLRSLPV